MISAHSSEQDHFMLLTVISLGTNTEITLIITTCKISNFIRELKYQENIQVTILSLQKDPWILGFHLCYHMESRLGKISFCFQLGKQEVIHLNDYVFRVFLDSHYNFSGRPCIPINLMSVLKSFNIMLYVQGPA